MITRYAVHKVILQTNTNVLVEVKFQAHHPSEKIKSSILMSFTQTLLCLTKDYDIAAQQDEIRRINLN